MLQSRFIYDENFLALPYLGVTWMVGSANFVLYIPLIALAILESGKTLITFMNDYQHYGIVVQLRT